MTHIQFRRHPQSGELYIVEVSGEDTNAITRAAGPVRQGEAGFTDTDGHVLTGETDMRDWLDNAGADAYDDGEWLTNAIAKATGNA